MNTDILTLESPNIDIIPDEFLYTLRSLGVQADLMTIDSILQQQNPYLQKRGGLGFGAYAMVNNSHGVSQFTNINIFNQIQASKSPYLLSLVDDRKFIISDMNGVKYSSGVLLKIPEWGSIQINTSRKQAIQILQQHGTRELVGMLGSTNCPLFEQGEGCEFCMLSGDNTNTERTVEEILEVFNLAKQYRPSYNLTLSTTWIKPDEYDAYVKNIITIKKQIGESKLALEITPLPNDNRKVFFEELKNGGLDTLMIPLDCSTEIAQETFLKGKAAILKNEYWNSIQDAVDIFGKGKVTSSLIIGLEPLENSLEAIREMTRKGVVAEPIPVRWDNEKLLKNSQLPLTPPKDLKIASDYARIFIQKLIQEGCGPSSGCATCRGCGG